MQIRIARSLTTAFAISLFSVSLATAEFTFDDIDIWVGDGAHESALIIDWNDGHTVQTRAWGYRYDGAPTAEQMFLDIVTADGSLFAKIGEDQGFGVPVFGIGYNTNGGDFGITDGSVFDDDGFTLTDDQHADGALALDAADQYQEGWFASGFWSHYIGSVDDTGAPQNPYTDGSWGFGGGLVTDILTNGSWSGLSFAPDFDFTPPSNPIPGPASLILPAAFLLAPRRRRV